jgi:hypothetical protein
LEEHEDQLSPRWFHLLIVLQGHTVKYRKPKTKKPVASASQIAIVIPVSLSITYLEL